MVVLSVMLSYMILFYCRTWCQTAKRITRAIKSIPTLFTGLWNVILPLFPLLLFFFLWILWKHTVAGGLLWKRDSLWACRWSAVGLPFSLFIYFFLLFIFFTLLPYRPFQLAADHCRNERPSGSAAGTGCHFAPVVTPTSLPRWKHAG